MDWKDRKEIEKVTGKFWTDLKTLMSTRPDPERRPLTILLLVGSLAFTAAAGALLGFVFAYKRLDLFERDKAPSLNDQPAAVNAAMIAGAMLGIVGPALLVLLIKAAVEARFGFLNVAIVYLLLNFLFSLAAFSMFRQWRDGLARFREEARRYGSSRFAFDEELAPYFDAPAGFYLGGYHYYPKSGHLLTVAGTRGGKGVNLILPNLLGLGRFNGSFVVIDPKGENAAVSARYQRTKGQNVVLLNPWELLGEKFTEYGFDAHTYNPLDILKNDRLNLSDDVQMIAEAIVPMTASGGATDHFDNRARSIISGLLLHLVTAGEKEIQHLGTLWEWLRLPDEQWQALLDTMAENSHPYAGDIVQGTANEIISLKAQGQKEYASVISTCQKWTDFLKSPALRKSLTPDENALKSSMLADGKTTVYVIIPADRLKTHAQWLRLVSSTLMRAVIRKPDKDVCFLLDEFYALGYLSEIEIALGSYAGYGVHVWGILQNLVQLQDTYGNNWENFISSCGVRHFFNVSDVTTAEYISKMLGTLSVPTYDNTGNISGASGRSLVNPDELRLLSNDTIYMILDHLHPAKIQKLPYYESGLVEGRDYDKNPYIRG